MKTSHDFLEHLAYLVQYSTNDHIHCVSRNATTFKWHSSILCVPILVIIGRNVRKISFACFSFHVDLLSIRLSPLKLHIHNNANVDVVSSKRV